LPQRTVIPWTAMTLKNFSFLALRALGYSPREAKRILDIATRSRLEFEESINAAFCGSMCSCPFSP